MNQEKFTVDQKTLSNLEERLKRGIPKWEQTDFIEMIVPLLVKKLQKYMKLDSQH